MLITIDWGTTSFRAYLFKSGSEDIIEQISVPAGIMQCGENEFETVFYRHLGAWLNAYPDAAVVASGMITSRQGWIETPYLPCPAGLDDLSRNLTSHITSQGQQIHFVPGVSQSAPVPNIMRGEETQMAGLKGAHDVTVILPGTHSKWIRMKGDTIEQFATFMTGELYGVITEHTILGRLLTDNEDLEAFRKGVQDGFSAPREAGGILSKLFGSRAMVLLELMGADGVRDYISGLLMGTEIEEALQSGYGETDAPLLCGSVDLVQRYEAALLLCGIETQRTRDDLAAYGLFRIAQSAGMIP